MKLTYLLVDVLSAIVPFLFSFHPAIRFDKKFASFLLANIITSILFLIWDLAFTTMGVWGFNDAYITGWKVFNLPVEEILFFTCIPFACLFTYHCLNRFFHFQWPERIEKIFICSVSLFLFVTGIIHIDRLYTAASFLSTALLLVVFKFVLEANWLPRLLSVYPILLIPFFIVNGILTGTGPDQPVVWYNNNENLGLRLQTIPVEDIVYGLELILINVFLFERLQHRFHTPRVLIHTKGKT